MLVRLRAFLRMEPEGCKQDVTKIESPRRRLDIRGCHSQELERALDA
jgi:hypothetical protein